jgi:hypothetical protein
MLRLYGNAQSLEKTGGNCMCNYYRLTLYIKDQESWYPVTAEQGFNGYSKKEIYKTLKSKIIKNLNQYGIQAR